MKKRYAIRYTGILEHGLVKLKFWPPKSKEEIKLPPDQYTRFRFHAMAKFWCRVLQKDSVRNLKLRNYSIIEVFD